MFQSPTEGLSGVRHGGVRVAEGPGEDRRPRRTACSAAWRRSPTARSRCARRCSRAWRYREFYSRGFGIITPTYAVVGRLAGGRRCTRRRCRGSSCARRANWRSGSRTPRPRKRLAKMPADGCGLQFCDPKSTAGNLCCIGPLFLEHARHRFGRSTRRRDATSTRSTSGSIPNGARTGQAPVPEPHGHARRRQDDPHRGERVVQPAPGVHRPGAHRRPGDFFGPPEFSARSSVEWDILGGQMPPDFFLILKPRSRPRAES